MMELMSTYNNGCVNILGRASEILEESKIKFSRRRILNANVLPRLKIFCFSI